jgi:methyl-accepting chemotaxis protein
VLVTDFVQQSPRAGEQERGFAMVATEMRSLSHRSAEAAKQIKSLIGGDSVNRVKDGAKLVD